LNIIVPCVKYFILLGMKPFGYERSHAFHLPQKQQPSIKHLTYTTMQHARHNSFYTVLLVGMMFFFRLRKYIKHFPFCQSRLKSSNRPSFHGDQHSFSQPFTKIHQVTPLVKTTMHCAVDDARHGTLHQQSLLLPRIHLFHPRRKTRMQLTGLPTEELIVVVAGGGSRRISAKYTIDADTAVDPLKKESQYQVKMLDVNSGRVELFDKVTGHSIATRISNGTAQFDADGLRFNLNGYAATGDSFDVLTGQKSAGDSRNMDEIMDLATSTVSRSSFQDDFRSIAASVGSTLESSRLSKLSAEAVRDAAVAAEDEVSGVNMDEEAAKLITQQQAYQAAARILQTAKEMFDTLMQIR